MTAVVLKNVGSLTECLKTRAGLITLEVMNDDDGTNYE